MKLEEQWRIADSLMVCKKCNRLAFAVGSEGYALRGMCEHLSKAWSSTSPGNVMGAESNLRDACKAIYGLKLWN
jgi:hypothetical protein